MLISLWISQNLIVIWVIFCHLNPIRIYSWEHLLVLIFQRITMMDNDLFFSLWINHCWYKYYMPWLRIGRYSIRKLDWGRVYNNRIFIWEGKRWEIRKTHPHQFPFLGTFIGSLIFLIIVNFYSIYLYILQFSFQTIAKDVTLFMKSLTNFLHI